MDMVTLSILSIIALLVLVFLHVPLGVAMTVVGFLAFLFQTGNLSAAFSLFSTEAVAVFSSTELAIIPLFLLMGSFAGTAGLSADVYRLAHSMIGHRRGGLAYASVAGCAGFGAVCGSSIATMLTFSRIGLPEMERRGYSKALGSGTIAAGGTLGQLIPPSTIIILYSYLTEQFVIEMFMAAVVPGICVTIAYAVSIAIYANVWKNAAPRGERVPWAERLRVLSGTWAILFIVGVVMGGIYGGIFTVNEAAAVGVGLTLMFAALRGRLRGESFWKALFDTACNVGMLYLTIFGAHIFSYFVAISQTPQMLVGWILSLELAPLAIIWALILMYIFAGMIFDEVAAMVITLPFVFPLVISLGYDPVWWGIVNLMVIAIGMITPPIGLNAFVLHGVRPDIPLGTIYRGITPFFFADMMVLTLIVFFPAIALWLPSTM